MMTSRELMTKVLNMEKGDRIPWAPAIYENKGYLIGKTPSEICRNQDWLVEGLLAELDVYEPDFLTVGIDVYNVEAEAVGCEVVYFDDSPDVPGVKSNPVQKPSDLDKMGIPDPTKDGRMPLYLGAAEEIQKQVGEKIIVRGAITGPFSLASELVGAENFIVMTMTDPNFARKLMKYAAKVSFQFAKAYIDKGIDPIIFDSRAMPPLCSPSVFEDIVAPAYARYVIPPLKEAGAKHIPLIIGGDTTPILEPILSTGVTQVLCDFEGDIPTFKKRCLEENIPMRVNVDPRLMHLGPIEKIEDFAMNILHQCWDHPGFIFGTGVAAYDCPKEHIMCIKECLEKDYKNYEPKKKRNTAKKTDAEAIRSDVAPTYDENLEPLLREMGEAIEEGDEEDVPELVQEALDDEFHPEIVINKAMIPAMDIVGDKFSKNELFVPEMLISARAMSAGMDVLRPALTDTGVEPIGKVLLGTVKGDIHDIGKNLVGMMLEGAGFEILDLGVNVPVERFIEELKKNEIHILGMSALLTTTMNYMGQVVKGLEAEGMRDTTKVLIGGAPINEKFCDKIEADYYAESAADAVTVAKMALNELKEQKVCA